MYCLDTDSVTTCLDIYRTVPSPGNSGLRVLHVGDLHGLGLGGVGGGGLGEVGQPGDGLHLHPAPVLLHALDDARQLGRGGGGGGPGHQLRLGQHEGLQPGLLLGGWCEHGLAGRGRAALVVEPGVEGVRLLGAVALDNLLPIVANQLVLQAPATLCTVNIYIKIYLPCTIYTVYSLSTHDCDAPAALLQRHPGPPLLVELDLGLGQVVVLLEQQLLAGVYQPPLGGRRRVRLVRVDQVLVKVKIFLNRVKIFVIFSEK